MIFTYRDLEQNEITNQVKDEPPSNESLKSRPDIKLLRTDRLDKKT